MKDPVTILWEPGSLSLEALAAEVLAYLEELLAKYAAFRAWEASHR